MNFFIKTIALLGCSFPLIASDINIDKASYAIGTQVANSIQDNIKRSQQYEVKINVDEIVKGFEETLRGQGTLAQSDVHGYLKGLDDLITKAQVKANKTLIEENKAAGHAFRQNALSSNKYQETQSGLQYREIKAGAGQSPNADSTVTVHYKGQLINGNVFDSSYQREAPAEFPLNGVIKGWTEGLQYMKQGSIYEFIIPSELAYGDIGSGNIPPGATLVFKVELIDVR